MHFVNFPSTRQFHEWDCGAVILQLVLAYSGIDVSGEKAVCIWTDFYMSNM